MRASNEVSSSDASPHTAQSTATTAGEFLQAIASSDPVPGGGSVSAYAGALSSALIRMVAGLTIGRKKYASVESEMAVVAANAEHLAESLSKLVERDADAYAAVSAAFKLPKDPADAVAARKDAITKALLGAAEVPRRRACARRRPSLLHRLR
jgi:glutamate formiminotransferase/formiminotetrahydrofolate cyclodeaminase